MLLTKAQFTILAAYIFLSLWVVIANPENSWLWCFTEKCGDVTVCHFQIQWFHQIARMCFGYLTNDIIWFRNLSSCVIRWGILLCVLPKLTLKRPPLTLIEGNRKTFTWLSYLCQYFYVLGFIIILNLGVIFLFVNVFVTFNSYLDAHNFQKPKKISNPCN